MSDFNQLKELEHTIYPIYEGYDLGLTYTPAGSKFKVWAPTTQQVHIALYNDAGVYDQEGNVQEHGGGQEFLMSRDDQGVWSIELEGDWNKYYYMYRLEWADNTIHYAADPYATGYQPTGSVQRSLIWLKPTRTDGNWMRGLHLSGRQMPFFMSFMYVIFRWIPILIRGKKTYLLLRDGLRPLRIRD